MTEPHSRPLAGLRVVLAGAAVNRRAYVTELEAAGASVQIRAVIRFRPPPDPSHLDSALRRLGDFDWLVLTSAQTVRALRQRLQGSRLSTPYARPGKVATIGEATNRAALRDLGWTSDLMPRASNTEGLLEALTGLMETTKAGGGAPSLLLPQSDLAPQDLCLGLQAAGFSVTPVIAYRTVANTPVAARLGHAIEAGGSIDALVFMSPSSVRAVRSRVSEPVRWPPVVALGTRTFRECRSAGTGTLTATSEPSPERVVATLTRLLRSRTDRPR